MAVNIGRRQFIVALGGAVVEWPLSVRAQQPSMPVVGFLDSGLPDGMTANLAAFQRGLGETGYTVGTNVKTAKALSLDIPPMLLALADEVIE